MTLIVNNAVADIENNDICKVNVLIIAVGVLFTAYKRIIAIFVCHIFHCGGGAAEVLNGEFCGFFITLSCRVATEDKTVISVESGGMLGAEFALGVFCYLSTLCIQSVFVAYYADSVLIANPCASAFTKCSINITNAILFDVSSCLVTVSAMNIDCVICLCKAYIVRAGTANITYIGIAYIGKHSHHTGYITFNKSLVYDACVRKALAGTSVWVVVYHYTVRTNRALVCRNCFTGKGVDGAGDDLVYIKPISVHIRGLTSGFFFITANKEAANAANSKKK